MRYCGSQGAADELRLGGVREEEVLAGDRARRHCPAFSPRPRRTAPGSRRTRPERLENTWPCTRWPADRISGNPARTASRPDNKACCRTWRPCRTSPPGKHSPSLPPATVSPSGRQENSRPRGSRADERRGIRASHTQHIIQHDARKDGRSRSSLVTAIGSQCRKSIAGSLIGMTFPHLSQISASGTSLSKSGLSWFGHDQQGIKEAGKRFFIRTEKTHKFAVRGGMQIAGMERGIKNFLIIATFVMAIRRMQRLMDIATRCNTNSR